MQAMRQKHLRNTKGEASMTKVEALQAIKLLSALESWAMSQQKTLPPYLDQYLVETMEVMERILLEEKP
jgi:hypothetical protein